MIKSRVALALLSAGVAGITMCSGNAFAVEGMNKYIPTTNGKPDFMVSKLDFVNDKIEFLYNSSNAGDKNLSKVAIYSCKQDYDCDGIDLLQLDNIGGYVWGTMLYHNWGSLDKAEHETIDSVTTKYTVDSFITPMTDVLPGKDNIIILLKFDDDSYWSSRVSYMDCAQNWSEGMGCKAASWTDQQETGNVTYETYVVGTGEAGDDSETENPSGGGESGGGNDTVETTPDINNSSTGKDPVVKQAEKKSETAHTGGTGNEGRSENAANSQERTDSSMENTDIAEGAGATTLENSRGNSENTENIEVPLSGRQCEGIFSMWWLWAILGALSGAALTWFLFDLLKSKDSGRR